MQDHRFTQPEEVAKGVSPQPLEATAPEPMVDRLAAFRGLLLGLGLAVAFWTLVAVALIGWLHHD